MQGSHYIDVLKTEFAERCRRNSSYSLRAFARDLDFLPSRLSDVMNGKQGLSTKSASHLAERLGFNQSEKEWFATLVESRHARSESRRKAARAQVKTANQEAQYHTLNDDVFAVISNWYHFALLELTTLSDFQPTLNWIAKRLGISIVETELAIERLIKVGLLEKKKGMLKATTTFPSAPGGTPSRAIKAFHQQILEKAGRALYLQDIARRDFSAITMAVDTKDMAKIQGEIKRFRRGLEKKYKQSEKKDGVYCLSIQFFSLLEENQVEQAAKKGKGM